MPLDVQNSSCFLPEMLFHYVADIQVVSSSQGQDPFDILVSSMQWQACINSKRCFCKVRRIFPINHIFNVVEAFFPIVLWCLCQRCYITSVIYKWHWAVKARTWYIHPILAVNRLILTPGDASLGFWSLLHHLNDIIQMIPGRQGFTYCNAELSSFTERP